MLYSSLYPQILSVVPCTQKPLSTLLLRERILLLNQSFSIIRNQYLVARQDQLLTLFLLSGCKNQESGGIQVSSLLILNLILNLSRSERFSAGMFINLKRSLLCVSLTFGS